MGGESHSQRGRVVTLLGLPYRTCTTLGLVLLCSSCPLSKCEKLWREEGNMVSDPCDCSASMVCCSKRWVVVFFCNAWTWNDHE